LKVILNCLKTEILVKYVTLKYVHMSLCQQPYHPVVQDWLPTEAKQGWAWLVPGWETFWEKPGCCWKRC